MTEREVSAAYGIPLGRLRQMRFLGTGPIFVKLGRSVRYRAGDIESYISAHVRRSTSDPGPAGEGERNAGE
jgi:hypothetical protein